MSEKTSVLLLIPRLNDGGAARVSLNVARGLAERGYRVHLAAITGRDEAGLPDGVSVHCLGCSRVRWSAPGLIRLVRELRPQVILSNMAHLNLLVLALRPALSRQMRIAVRNDGGTRPERLPRARRAAFRWLHTTADAVICQSEEMKAELAEELGSAELLRVLFNPVDVAAAREADRGEPQWSLPGEKLIAVGRLVKEKGFDLLLEAFRQVAERFSDAQLTIVGDGPERGFLEMLATGLGIAARVHFAGEEKDSRLWFAGATAFILSSREDAMPNALLEAAAAGLPIVATPARGGVPAMLKNQVGAWVAEEVSAKALASTITEALGGIAPGERFEHPWLEPFAWPNAMDGYDELIRSLASAE